MISLTQQTQEYNLYSSMGSPKSNRKLQTIPEQSRIYDYYAKCLSFFKRKISFLHQHMQSLEADQFEHAQAFEVLLKESQRLYAIFAKTEFKSAHCQSIFSRFLSRIREVIHNFSSQKSKHELHQYLRSLESEFKSPTAFHKIKQIMKALLVGLPQTVSQDRKQFGDAGQFSKQLSDFEVNLRGTSHRPELVTCKHFQARESYDKHLEVAKRDYSLYGCMSLDEGHFRKTYFMCQRDKVRNENSLNSDLRDRNRYSKWIRDSYADSYRKSRAGGLDEDQCKVPLSQTKQTKSRVPLSQTRQRVPLSQTRQRVPLNHTKQRVPLNQKNSNPNSLTVDEKVVGKNGGMRSSFKCTAEEYGDARRIKTEQHKSYNLEKGRSRVYISTLTSRSNFLHQQKVKSFHMNTKYSYLASRAENEKEVTASLQSLVHDEKGSRLFPMKQIGFRDQRLQLGPNRFTTQQGVQRVNQKLKKVLSIDAVGGMRDSNSFRIHKQEGSQAQPHNENGLSKRNKTASRCLVIEHSKFGF